MLMSIDYLSFFFSLNKQTIRIILHVLLHVPGLQLHWCGQICKASNVYYAM